MFGVIPCQIIFARSIVWLELEQLLVSRFCAAPVTAPVVHLTDAKISPSRLWRLLNDLPEGIQGSVIVRLPRQHISQSLPGRGELRIYSDRLAKKGLGLRVPASHGHKIARHFVSFRPARALLQSRLQHRECGVSLLLHDVSQAQKI